MLSSNLPMAIQSAVCAAVALASAPQAHCQVFTWDRGDYESAGLPIPIASSMVVNAIAGGGKSLNTGLSNRGIIAWNTIDALTLVGNDSSRLHNEGLFLQQTDGHITYVGGLPSTFDNAGALRKSGGSGDLLLDVAVLNRAGGVLDAASGRIVYRTSSTFEAGSVFNGSGTHVFGGPAAIYSFGGSFSGENNLRFAGGTFNATAPTKPQTDATWSGGIFTGHWTIDSGRTLSVVPGFGKAIAGSFTNDGTIAWNTANTLTIEGNGAGSLRNNGLFLQQADGLIAYTGGLPPTFDNAGTLRKSGGNGDLRIFVSLNNTGVIESLSGNIALPSDWGNNGILRGNAAFQTNELTNAGTIAPGLPTTVDAIATLRLTGALIEARTGSLSFDVAAGGVSDVLNVTGSVSFDGTINVTRAGSYLPQIGDRFRVMNFASYTGSVFDVVELGFDSGVMFTADYAPTFLELRVTAVPEPGSWALSFAGLLMVATITRRRLHRSH